MYLCKRYTKVYDEVKLNSPMSFLKFCFSGPPSLWLVPFAIFGIAVACLFQLPMWILKFRLRNKEPQMEEITGIPVSIIDQINALELSLRSVKHNNPLYICKVIQTPTSRSIHLMLYKEGVLCESHYFSSRVSTRLLSSIVIYLIKKHATPR